jgi:hypothetical protein
VGSRVENKLGTVQSSIRNSSIKYEHDSIIGFGHLLEQFLSIDVFLKSWAIHVNYVCTKPHSLERGLGCLGYLVSSTFWTRVYLRVGSSQLQFLFILISSFSRLGFLPRGCWTQDPCPRGYNELKIINSSIILIESFFGNILYT